MHEVLAGPLDSPPKKIIWIREENGYRLFSVGVSGYIVEWNWQKGGKLIVTVSL